MKVTYLKDLWRCDEKIEFDVTIPFRDTTEFICFTQENCLEDITTFLNGWCFVIDPMTLGILFSNLTDCLQLTAHDILIYVC